MNKKIDKNIYLKIVIPQQHQAVFLLTIQGIDTPKLYSESINIKTNYQVKTISFISLDLVLFFCIESSH
jgi:hypothetical protein